MRSVAWLMVLGLIAGLQAAPAASQESPCPKPERQKLKAAWPARPGKKAFDVVHFGEGHWNEGQGPLTMPLIVRDIAAFRPEWVAFSSDQADTGTPDRLGCFRQLMAPLPAAGIPWYASPGNHDRTPVAGPGGFTGELEIWRDVYAGMPAPWGDRPAPKGFLVPESEPDDGPGAASHYYVDYGPNDDPVLRLIVLDNSLQSLTTSDTDQFPATGPGQTDMTQLAYLQRVAADASEEGLLTFVLMHQPTQDPRDPSGVWAGSINHTMGKGASPDNAAFDLIAQQTGVDVVGLGHIQGNAIYSAGEVEYFIDGGGGGSPYTNGEVGTDTGYYYGFRILRFFQTNKGWNYRTYFVPLVDEVKIDAPRAVGAGEMLEASAVALQPHDPELPSRFGGANEQIALEVRPPQAPAQFRSSVPELTYVWETSNPAVLAPKIDREVDPVDDPIFDKRTMNITGAFEAVGSGSAILRLRIGTTIEEVLVVVGKAARGGAGTRI